VLRGMATPRRLDTVAPGLRVDLRVRVDFGGRHMPPSRQCLQGMRGRVAEILGVALADCVDNRVVLDDGRTVHVLPQHLQVIGKRARSDERPSSPEDGASQQEWWDRKRTCDAAVAAQSYLCSACSERFDRCSQAAQPQWCIACKHAVCVFCITLKHEVVELDDVLTEGGVRVVCGPCAAAHLAASFGPDMVWAGKLL
jgi:hypothetical protein